VVEDCVRLLQGCSEEDLMKTEEIVSRNPRVMHGELVFAGTRVPVQTLVDYFKAGDTLDVFLEDFPTVDREQAVAYLEMTLKAADLERAAG
jgi:uncharacterized protein (DUF433 family)